LLNCVRFPRYSYDSSSSTLTVQRWSDPIQESRISTISKGFDAAGRSLPPSIQGRMSIVKNPKYKIFDGIYTGSEKVPDLVFRID